jgi:hypothetical protein
MKPRSINIFLLDGDPNGIRVAQIMMSTIQAIAFRRNKLGEVRKTFPEIERPGVYILIGDDESEPDRQLSYIGESECIGERLATHNSNKSGRDSKDFWTDTVVLISKPEHRCAGHWGCTKPGFIPCSAEALPDAMSAWEAYIHAPAPDALIQLAVLHAEFEAIHPFLDGNGRLGRLIIPLFLKSKGLLSAPNFYLSEYLEAHRDEYYDRLLAVSRDGDWTGWCGFFLRAIIEQAGTNQAKAQAIHALYNARKDWMVDATRSQYGVRALDWFFSRPIFVASDFVSQADIPEPTAKRILRLVRDNGLLREIRPSSGRRPAVLAFPDLLNICEGRTAF